MSERLHADHDRIRAPDAPDRSGPRRENAIMPNDYRHGAAVTPHEQQNQRINFLEGLADQRQATIAELKEQRDQARNDTRSLRAELDATNATLETIREQRDDTRAKLAARLTESEQARAEADNLRMQNKILAADLTANHDHDGKLLAELRAKVYEQRGDINRQAETIRGYRAQVDSLTAQNEAMRTDHVDDQPATADRNNLLAQIATLECDLRDANHRADYWLKECKQWRESAETITPTPAEPATQTMPTHDPEAIEIMPAELRRITQSMETGHRLAAERFITIENLRAELDVMKRVMLENERINNQKIDTSEADAGLLATALECLDQLSTLAVHAFLENATISPLALRDILFSDKETTPCATS